MVAEAAPPTRERPKLERGLSSASMASQEELLAQLNEDPDNEELL
jgi:hypothetical protein|eukprot:COSAG01_NODE_3639_length_5840_cov_3.816060_5_plen_45_part_00